MDLRNLKNIYLHKIVFIILLLVFIGGGKRVYAQYYPVHATVQWPSPQSPYLSDYYNGSRDRLIVTLYNRDLQQSQLFAKLRIRIKSPGFLATSREELSYPMLELNANVPTRLSNIDLSSYLQPENLNTSGSLRNGQLPVGYTEFSVQVVDYYTGRVLSDWHTGRSYLDNSRHQVILHAPGLVTGSIEVVAQKVTDLTSLCTLVYDIATSEETRSNLALQFKNIKDEIGEDPKAFFPIFRDVVLTVTTGNTPEEWDKSINSKDSGERSHLATRGTGNAILTLMSGAAIVKNLPEIADKLGDAIKKVKRISQTLEDFIAKSLPEKLEDIENIWKTKYPMPDMLEGRSLFEDMMGEYRYRKADGWVHTADIAENFKGVDFYKGTEIGNQIFAETAVSMKTTIITDVDMWLNSKPIQGNIKNLKDGLKNGIQWGGKNLRFKQAEIQIYVPKENIGIKEDWMKTLKAKHPEIEFKIDILEDYIK